MEDISRSRAHNLSRRGFAPFLAITVVGLLVTPSLAVADAPEVLGTWHVLIHYKDDNAPHPERERWDDRVWVFEKAGSRLRWTEYPLVVFDDQTGRFERSSGRSARVLEFWEPSPLQISDIKDGLAVNERGMKSKSLRDREDKWASLSRNTSSSVSVISYVEHWSVENGEGGPVFRREDVLGSERSENLDGVTLYTTQRVESGGNVLRGKFERDGSRRGTFRMMRSGATEGLKSDGRSPNEKASDRARQAIEALGYTD